MLETETPPPVHACCTRRTFIRLGGLGVSALAGGTFFSRAFLFAPQTDEDAHKLMDRLLPHLPSGNMARQLGKAYLEKHPQARLLSLTQQLTQHWSDADFFGARSVHRLHTQLARQIDKDYRKQRLFILGPAIFSETEAQLAALAVMAG